MSDATANDFEARLMEVRLVTSASFDDRVQESMRAAFATQHHPTGAEAPAKEDSPVTVESTIDAFSQCSPRTLHLPRRLAKAAGLAAAAAVVLAGMFWLLTGGPKSELTAYAALADAVKNSKTAECVHFKMESGGMSVEGWISFKPARSAIKTPDGLRYTDARARKTYAYNYASKTITVSTISKDLEDLDEFANAASLFDAFVSRLDELEKQGVTIEKTSLIVDGKSCDVYAYDSATETHSIAVDPPNRRIVRIQRRPLKGDSSAVSRTVTMDYPAMGPEDIYALGAPRDARVVNWGYGEAKALSDKVNAARDAFASRYFAIVVRQPESQPEAPADSQGWSHVTVEYRKDKRSRIEKYVENASTLASQADCNDAASLESWTRGHGLSAVDFYDGRDHKPGTNDITYITINKDGTLSKTAFEIGRLLCVVDTVEWATRGYWQGRAGLDTLPLPAKDGSNGRLEGVEETHPAQNEDRTPATTRSGWYFNPQRDYAAEEYVLLWFGSLPPRPLAPSIGLPQGFSTGPGDAFEYVQVQKITQYAQTPAGRWYAKKLACEWATHDRKVRQNTTVFLDATREIPDDLFDVAKFEAAHQAAAK